MKFHIISLFPESFDSYMKSSIIGRAIKESKISVDFYNPRDFTTQKHKQVDDKPYGGGPGMVMQAEPVIKAIEKAKGRKKKVKIIFFSPSGTMFDAKYADNLASSKKYTDVIFICGRYEGVDARIKEVFEMEDVSIGNFVLTGGELPAMIMIDTIARYIPGVLGKMESNETHRNASANVYTRPETLTYKKKKYSVPEVLMGGNHAEIEKWRKSGC
jgi:tRNA (guanine37-N1)-methyltransferase